MNLNNTKALVRTILERDRMSRNSDHILYLRVLQAITENSTGLAPLQSVTVIDFLDMLTKANCPYPGFETVRRSRQKVQQECPHLAADSVIQEYRAENEEAYRDFARS